MPTQALPEPDDVRNVLHGLLGRDITVTRETAASIPLEAKYVVGLYEREDAKVGGLVVADLELAAYAGAALSLLPIGVAKESIADGVIEDSLLENFREVLNVGVQWFTAKGNPRVVLAEVYPPGAPLPDDVKLVMAAPNDRLDVDAEVAGYGKGRIRLLAMDF
jgi:hypothetical protein